jgi:sterol desaturase/sphingolipid hydroxylase (fatty acid hydroxylase superfamily)
MSEGQIRPKNKGTKVLFQNPLVERLSRSHVGIPITILVTFGIGLAYYGLSTASLTIASFFLVFTTGLLLFTLVEYLVHRYVFHMGTETRLKEKMQYNFHGVHHEYPKDKERLAMPPLLSATLALILFFIFEFLMGNYVFAFLPGFLIGYSMYLFVHFAVHAYQPPKNFLKVLWINHGIHHYKDHDKAFGVSSPLWDFIFRTLP